MSRLPSPGADRSNVAIYQRTTQASTNIPTITAAVIRDRMPASQEPDDRVLGPFVLSPCFDPVKPPLVSKRIIKYGPPPGAAYDDPLQRAGGRC